MDFRKRFSALLKRFRRIFMWLTRVDRQDRALKATGDHLDYLEVHMYPLGTYEIEMCRPYR